MTKREIVQHLEQAQCDAIEIEEIEEISKSELDRIATGGGSWFANATFNKAFGK